MSATRYDDIDVLTRCDGGGADGYFCWFKCASCGFVSCDTLRDPDEAHRLADEHECGIGEL